jgi:hypothetical protein
MLLERLFGRDPYADFPAEAYPLDDRGFNLPEKALSLVVEVRASRIIEVGTWKGRSAFFMADRLTAADVPFELVCVDTWLGSTERWYDEAVACKREKALKLQHGRPGIYEQFIANVIKKGYARSIVPFPVPSTIAFKVLRKLGYTAQFVYIDGNHDQWDVAHDIRNYWQLLEPGGILCGDDYTWSGVNAAVTEFVDRTGYLLERAPEEYSWWIRKCKS